MNHYIVVIVIVVRFFGIGANSVGSLGERFIVGGLLVPVLGGGIFIVIGNG